MFILIVSRCALCYHSCEIRIGSAVLQTVLRIHSIETRLFPINNYLTIWTILTTRSRQATKCIKLIIFYEQLICRLRYHKVLYFFHINLLSQYSEVRLMLEILCYSILIINSTHDN